MCLCCGDQYRARDQCHGDRNCGVPNVSEGRAVQSNAGLTFVVRP